MANNKLAWMTIRERIEKAFRVAVQAKIKEIDARFPMDDEHAAEYMGNHDPAIYLLENLEQAEEQVQAALELLDGYLKVI